MPFDENESYMDVFDPKVAMHHLAVGQILEMPEWTSVLIDILGNAKSWSKGNNVRLAIEPNKCQVKQAWETCT